MKKEGSSGSGIMDDMSMRSSSIKDDPADENVSYNQLKLFLNTPKNDKDDASVGGFGWMNEFGFYFASYN